MNSEYQKRMDAANDAANKFFEQVKKTGNWGLLDEDDEIEEMFFKAFDAATDGSEEEKDFHFNLLEIGELEKTIGSRKTLTRTELAPIYQEFTKFLDVAIEENDRNKKAYIERRAIIIAQYNEGLEKLGYTIKKSGCYIATAVYGSYDCPQVWTLRRYRDSVLASSLFGRVFIQIYYSVSPALVKWFGNKPWFIRLCRGPLDIIVGNLQSKGYADVPYDDFVS